MKRAFLSTLSLFPVTLSLAMAQQASAKPAVPPSQLELGRNAAGNPCQATRVWNDAGVIDPFATSWSFTCRGSTANRYLGMIRAIEARDVAALDATLECGADQVAMLQGVGEVQTRRCFDKVLGQVTIETRVKRGSKVFSVSALPLAQGPAEEALRIVTGSAAANLDRGRKTVATVDPAALAPPPEVETSTNAAVADAEAALKQGLRFIRQGLNLDASRVANDALARLPESAAPSARVELLLLAGLADSNLTFFDSADDYFERADRTLKANAGIPGAEILVRKRASYAALHLLNKREFSGAMGLKVAQADPSAAGPLLDPATIRLLNRRSDRSGQASDVVAAADDAGFSNLVLDAQEAWARSVALLGQNQPAGAAQQLVAADRSFEALTRERVPQQRLFWLSARIERQRARLLLRNGDRDGALKALDKAIAQLRVAEGLGDAGPTLAQTQLERAAVLAGGNMPRETVFAQFDDAITSLVSSGADAGGLPPQTRSYLDALSADARANPASAERFFKTLQAAANPAIARQFVELQSLVTADPALGGKVQDLQEIEAEINRIRYEVTTIDNADTAKLTQLEGRREKLENQSLALQTELAANRSYAQVVDAPVTIQELRAALQPGEVYVKLSAVGGYVFSAVIDGSSVTVYRVDRPSAEIAKLVSAVRDSITGTAATAGKVPVYSVAGASALYKLLFGPGASTIMAAKSLVVDASGVLDSLPAGVMVVDDASVAAFAKSRKADAYDYTKVGFLGSRVRISTSLSPRSLLVSRNLAPSQAPYPFIGFAQHEPVSLTAQAGSQLVAIGNGCETEKGKVAQLGQMLKPIDARELNMAAGALGVTKPVEVTGAQFTDTAITQRSDLNQFQVLHFATHGLTEGQWGCSKAPPALVTTLGEGGSDGILSFDEVAKLRLDANLVVLSACDTAAGVSSRGARAAGTEQVGASLDGLVRSFLAARAHAVLSTYWPVSDAGETEALITDFYRNARTDSIGEALFKAEGAMMANKASSHPRYWAPFFVVGDASKPLLTGPARMAVDQAAGTPTSGAQSTAAQALR